MYLFFLVLCLFYKSDWIQAQISDSFICVLPNLCPGNINPRNWIDVRIEVSTPTTTTSTPASITQCPTGLIPCNTFPSCGIPNIQPNSLNGYATRGSFPWQIYLTSRLENENETYIGSGVLLDPYHVLTAAHKTNETNLRVYVGIYNPRTDLSSAVSRSVQCVRIKSDYNSATLKNDIAILRLSQPITLGANAIPGCIPNATTSFVNYQRCIVSGWGQSGFSIEDAATIMKQAYVNVTDYSTCLASLINNGRLPNAEFYLDQYNEICAGGESGVDACTKDGGAPLVCFDGTKYNVAGLVIWGKNCAQPGVYGVYVSVPVYRNWINCILNCLNSAAVACPETYSCEYNCR